MLLAACAALCAPTVHAQNIVNTPSVGLENVRSLPLTETGALTMMARGDNWAGTNAFKALVAKNDSALNRFNLATGYQRTGRLDQAKAIYRDLLTDGQFTQISAVGIKGRGVRTFNASDEAASRLLYIQWLQDGGSRRVAANQLSGAMSADTAGVFVSANEGGPIGDVSDEQAAILDRQARSQGGAAQ
jgi:hypothetical protein